MDYEQKYKEAFKRARNIRFGDPNSATANVVCEEIFPELKESEDEKIRKELITFIKQEANSATLNANRLKFKSMLAWLEKQGEQNNIVERLTAFAQHLQKRGAFRDDLFMDFEHEAQSFIEMQYNKEL